MFFLIPWRVDVPQDRWPVMNWLIILATVAFFALQVAEIAAYHTNPQHAAPQNTRRTSPATTAPSRPSEEPRPRSMKDIPGITGKLVLDGWSLKGLVGHMWLHGGVFHLFGNMLFLWIFGNALCAKLGNLRYLGLYVLFGVLAAIAQLLCDPHPALGASGAINGVVGAYLVLFFQNEITCLFAFWPVVLLYVYVRWFTVSSIWMVLFWLSWDIVGTIRGGSHVGHFAHLGGFAAGLGIALLMCHKGWITMEKYEKSLLQLWQEWRRGKEKEPLDVAYAQLGLRPTEEELQEEATDSGTPAELEVMSAAPTEPEPPPRLGADGFIRTACACGNAIRVTRQYAGRTVRCPRCRQPIVIPAQSEFFGPAPALPPLVTRRPQKVKDKYIRFICTCGKRMKVPIAYAGHHAQCPQCGIKLKIPDL